MTHIIEEHIITELDMLKTITDSEEGITRLAFTDMDWRGRDYIKSLMADAGLTIREDALLPCVVLCACPFRGVLFCSFICFPFFVTVQS